MGGMVGLQLEEVCSGQPQGSVLGPDLFLGSITAQLWMKRAHMCVCLLG